MSETRSIFSRSILKELSKLFILKRGKENEVNKKKKIHEIFSFFSTKRFIQNFLNTVNKVKSSILMPARQTSGTGQSWKLRVNCAGYSQTSEIK